MQRDSAEANPSTPAQCDQPDEHESLEPRDPWDGWDVDDEPIVYRVQPPLITDLVVFDLETNGLFPDQMGDVAGGEGSAGLPSITCAATSIMRWDCLVEVWVHRDHRVWHPEDLSVCSYMSKEKIKELVVYLHEHTMAGTPATGWNSLGFDTRLLHAHVEGDADGEAMMRRVALDQVDVMYNFLLYKGFPVSLDRVAEGMGTLRKNGSGADMIETWKTGTEAERRDVIAYCEHDVKVTAQVIEAVHRSPVLVWKAKVYPAGHEYHTPPSKRKKDPCLEHRDVRRMMEPVREAMNRPFPYTRARRPGGGGFCRDGTDGWLRLAIKESAMVAAA